MGKVAELVFRHAYRKVDSPAAYKVSRWRSLVKTKGAGRCL